MLGIYPAGEKRAASALLFYDTIKRNTCQPKLSNTTVWIVCLSKRDFLREINTG